MAGQQSRQQDAGGGGVGQGVGGGGGQGGGLDLPGQPPVEEKHPQLDRHRDRQNSRRQRREGHRLRVDDFVQGGLAQFHPHQEDEHGHHQPGQILHPAVAEGVFLVCFLAGQAEAHQGDHRGGRVRQVVKGVGGDGDGGGGDAREELAQKEQQVQPDAHRSGQRPAPLPGLRGLGGSIPDAETEKSVHKVTSQSREIGAVRLLGRRLP